MKRFAFIFHPLGNRDPHLRAAYEAEGYTDMTNKAMDAWLEEKQPWVISKPITGVHSLTGAETEGWFIVIPRTSRRFIQVMEAGEEEDLIDEIVFAVRLAEEREAVVVGLGAFTGVVKDAGLSVSQRSNILVTSGSSYTVYTTVQSALRGAEVMGIDCASATAAVVGPGGSIGKVCARMLAPLFKQIILIGRDLQRTEEGASDLRRDFPDREIVATTMKNCLLDADVVITASSSDRQIITAQDLKPGAVVADAARPRDVAKSVYQDRQDVLVFDAGVIEVPGNVQFNHDFGLGMSNRALACMSETMLIALEYPHAPCSLGRDISLQQVELMGSMGEKHGFRVAGFCHNNHPLTPEKLADIRVKAGR